MLIEIVSILQVLFAGIAFALAFLAYRLVRSIADQPQVDPTKIKLSNTFMFFAFSIGALAIAAQFFNNLATPRSNVELDAALSTMDRRVDAQAENLDDVNEALQDLNTFADRKPTIQYVGEPSFYDLNGRSPKSNRCPEDQVMTGASGWEPAGPESLAVYKVKFECRKIEVSYSQ